jgi:AcrR family transcriptional regulator
MSPDPRLGRSREKVLAAAVEILQKSGGDGLTIEAVCACSGVAKSTIYRQFADSDEVHVAALESLEGPPPVPKTGDLRADLEWWMHAFAHNLRCGPLAPLILTALDAAERSEHMSELTSRVISQRRRVMIGRLRTAVAAGELPATTDVDFLATQLVAPLFYRRFFLRQPLTKPFVGKVLDSVLGPLLSAPLPARDAT